MAAAGAPSKPCSRYHAAVWQFARAYIAALRCCWMAKLDLDAAVAAAEEAGEAAEGTRVPDRRLLPSSHPPCDGVPGALVTPGSSSCCGAGLAASVERVPELVRFSGHSLGPSTSSLLAAESAPARGPASAAEEEKGDGAR